MLNIQCGSSNSIQELAFSYNSCEGKEHDLYVAPHDAKQVADLFDLIRNIDDSTYHAIMDKLGNL